MYNYSLNLTYQLSDNDDIYRKELLQFFNLPEFDYDIINKYIKNIICEVAPHFEPIYKKMNEKNQMPFTLDKQTCITLLFDWEHFYLFYLCLKEIKENAITNSITNLLNKLKMGNK